MKIIDRYWRVFYTKSNCEKKCEEYIISRNIESYLPLVKSIYTYRGRKIRKELPLFKNYIFALVDEKERLSILEFPSLVRCLSYNGKPAKVTEKEINSIGIALREPEKIQIEDFHCKLGDEVFVNSGIFKGLYGNIIEIRGSKRVVISLKEIQKSILVNVDFRDINVHTTNN